MIIKLLLWLLKKSGYHIESLFAREKVRWYTDLIREGINPSNIGGKTDLFFNMFWEQDSLNCIIDSKGNFLIVNPKWEEVMGYTNDEISGTNFSHYLHPDDFSRTIAYFSKVHYEEGDRYHFKNRYLTKSGDSVTLLWSPGKAWHPYSWGSAQLIDS